MPIERVTPGPGQESVWDYPRPPRLEVTNAHVVVEFAGEIVADTRSAIRCLETSHPPGYYIPPADVRSELLIPSDRTSYCEWKGEARYVSLLASDSVAQDAAWFYPRPTARYADLAGYYAFYPQRVGRCTVDGEIVRAQEGDFYGGWITSGIVGPFKGAPGTGRW